MENVYYISICKLFVIQLYCMNLCFASRLGFNFGLGKLGVSLHYKILHKNKENSLDLASTSSGG